MAQRVARAASRSRVIGRSQGKLLWHSTVSWAGGQTAPPGWRDVMSAGLETGEPVYPGSSTELLDNN